MQQELVARVEVLKQGDSPPVGELRLVSRVPHLLDRYCNGGPLVCIGVSHGLAATPFTNFAEAGQCQITHRFWF
jgi:hypothetical protein